MILLRTERFQKQVRSLMQKNDKLIPQITKTLHLLSQYPPAAPSLRLKAIKGTKGIYECSVNMHVRITLEFLGEDRILLRNIDNHDKAFRSP